MPYDVNNIDACVSANFLFGIVYQMKFGYKPAS